MARLAQAFPWTVAGAIAAVLLLALQAMVQVPPSPQGTYTEGGLDGGGMLMADLAEEQDNETLIGELALKDPTPLFLPTDRNSGQVDLAMTVERAPGSSFGEFDPKLVFPLTGNDLDLPDVVRVPTSALGTLDRFESPVRGGELSRLDPLGEGLPERWGLLKVLSAETGHVVHEQTVVGSQIAGLMEAPVEALLAVNAGGLWLRPTVVESPEGVTVDFEQINLLLQEAHLGSLLQPGFYRILLGP